MRADSAAPNPSQPDADLLRAHGHCADHRSEVLGGASCGCFSCCAMFPTEEIRDWTSVLDDVGHTACVRTAASMRWLGESLDYDLTPELLVRMNDAWF